MARPFVRRRGGSRVIASDAPYPTLTGDGARRLLGSRDRVVVVGAGGWLGLATLEALHETLGKAFAERVVCFGSTERTLALRGGLTIRQRPLEALCALPPAPTLVLHLAFLTQEKAKAMSNEAYIAANEGISNQVLAALDPIGARAVFVASSGAVYLADDAGAEASKRLYGRLKLADEARFTRWAETMDKRAAIARVFNVSGPYINKRSSYALACFIADALADRPIRIKATRPVFRSYVAISELMSVAFGAMTEERSGVVAFDAAGDEVYEMARIARMVGNVLGCQRGVERPPLGSGAPDRYNGDGGGYTDLRRRFGIESVNFSRQVGETARFMAETTEAA